MRITLSRSIPELLAPAGTIKSMQYAFAYGADAVYAGHPRYSLRARNNDFSMENLEKGISYAHEIGKKVYITSNIFPHNNKVKTYIEHMKQVAQMKPDAFIMADPGLIMLAREAWPEIPVHLSVQANTINYASVNFWKSVGVSRVILSRELTLKEIEEIRQLCPDMELEVFIHGALCISYSGRCLLSGYFNKRDANQGTCSNSCRWKYKLYEEPADYQGAPLVDECGEQRELVEKEFFLEEQERKGQMMPVTEDEHGTYIMNSKDLRAIEYVENLAKIGIDSIKVEGRTKSHYYVSRTVASYRKALDDAAAGKDFDRDLLRSLDGLSNREYTAGFMGGYSPSEMQNYDTGNSNSKYQKFVGEVISDNIVNGYITIDVKNRFKVGDSVELLTSAGNYRFTIEEIVLDKNEERLDVAPGSGYVVRIPFKVDCQVKFGLLVVDISD